MENKMLVFGDSQFASMVGDYITSETDYNLMGFCVDDDYISKSTLDGHPVIPFSSVKKLYAPSDITFFLALGYRSMRARKLIFNRLLAEGYHLANLVSRQSFVHKSVQVGVNNIVMPGVVVEPGVCIADNNIFWSNTTVCHDSEIGSHNFFSANSTVGGNVKIHDCSFFGFSSVILQSVVVANETLLGALSLLNRDSVNCGKYTGSPGRLVDSHADHGIRI